MESISISELVKWSGGELLSGDLESEIKSVCVDSRNVSSGSLFVPIKGMNVDGHDFILNAFEKGAIASLTEKEISQSDDKKAIILVKDTVNALQAIAKNYRNKFNIPFIGVTGSVGKTTTKEMIASVLSKEMNVLKNDGNFNGQIGVPLTLFNLESHHEAAVIEMGISEFGEMDKLADMVNLDIGVVTNIGVSHMENFKTRENIREEKLKLVKDYNGKYFLNGDSPLLSDFDSSKLKEVTYFGLNGSYEYRAEEISSVGDSTEFVLVTEGYRENIKIPCLGIHNVYNALAAISVGLSMGMYLDDIKSGLLNYKGVAMRQQIIDIGGIKIIDDSYNASPDSVKSSIGVLRSLSSKGKNIAILSDMLELGDTTEKIHYELGKYIALEKIDILITTGNLAKFIHQGASDSTMPIKSLHCKNNEEAANLAYDLIQENDKVMVKGSRSMHTDEIVRWLKSKIEKEGLKTGKD